MIFARTLLAFLSAGTLGAADSVVIRTNYYSITGEDFRALREDIVRKRPWKEEQDGFTRWKVNWSFTSRESRAGCTVNTIQISTDITITLPRWTASEPVDESLRVGWQNYMTG